MASRAEKFRVKTDGHDLFAAINSRKQGHVNLIQNTGNKFHHLGITVEVHGVIAANALVRKVAPGLSHKEEWSLRLYFLPRSAWPPPLKPPLCRC